MPGRTLPRLAARTVRFGLPRTPAHRAVEGQSRMPTAIRAGTKRTCLSRDVCCVNRMGQHGTCLGSLLRRSMVHVKTTGCRPPNFSGQPSSCVGALLSSSVQRQNNLSARAVSSSPEGYFQQPTGVSRPHKQRRPANGSFESRRVECTLVPRHARPGRSKPPSRASA